jgi:hypothetical protein
VAYVKSSVISDNPRGKMKFDPAWGLASGFFILGLLAALLVAGGGFIFLTGFHSGLIQNRPECPPPALHE